MKTGHIRIMIDKKVYFEPENEKRLIEVSNDYIVSPLPGTAHLWIQDTSRLRYLIKDGQKCKAEVNGTAKIIGLTIELTKY